MARQCYASEGEVKRNGKPADTNDPVIALMGRVSALCNDAELFQEGGAWKVEGDPTEGALYPFAAKLGINREAERKAYPRIDVIPFESEHKFMATLHKSGDGSDCLLVKGAPEVILDHCRRRVHEAGREVQRDPAIRHSQSLGAVRRAERGNARSAPGKSTLIDLHLLRNEIRRSFLLTRALTIA